MHIKNALVYNKIIDARHFEIGDVYIFKNFVITQINHGKHVTINSSKELIDYISSIYGNKKPFVYLSNRINKYSIELLDYPKHSNLFPNIIAYGVVGYSAFNKLNVNMENKFSIKPVFDFSSIEEAVNYSNNIVNKYSVA